MSVDRAQIEHLRSFVATPRCMSYETIRSLGDILDNLEAASAEVAALRRQLEERKSPDVVTVPREEWDVIARLLEWVQTGRVTANEEGCCMCGASPGGCENDHPYTDMAIYYWHDLRAKISALRSGEAGKGVSDERY